MPRLSRLFLLLALAVPTSSLAVRVDGPVANWATVKERVPAVAPLGGPYLANLGRFFELGGIAQGLVQNGTVKFDLSDKVADDKLNTDPMCPGVTRTPGLLTFQLMSLTGKAKSGFFTLSRSNIPTNTAAITDGWFYANKAGTMKGACQGEQIQARYDLKLKAGWNPVRLTVNRAAGHYTLRNAPKTLLPWRLNLPY